MIHNVFQFHTNFIKFLKVKKRLKITSFLLDNLDWRVNVFYTLAVAGMEQTTSRS